MDNKEKLLNITLAHEFNRCTKDFESFCFLSATLPDNNTKVRHLDCYNTYVDFLSHLYEFYIGLIKKDSKFKQKGIYKDYESFKNKQEHEIIDLIFNEEVGKLFRNRKNRILNGYKDNLGYRIDFYECDIPEKFGEHFRYMRNRRNHVDYRRASNNFDISLKDFFELYHKFILILYYECVWLWHVNEDEFDWLAIDDFASEILKEKK
jgi:hypothetical protein